MGSSVRLVLLRMNTIFTGTNTMVGSSTTLSYTDTGVPYGYYEYYIKAVYYFGESGNSDPAGVIVGIDEMNASEFQFFPNPASNHDYYKVAC